jgi:hypothetical protein
MQHVPFKAHLDGVRFIGSDEDLVVVTKHFRDLCEIVGLTIKPEATISTRRMVGDPAHTISEEGGGTHSKGAGEVGAQPHGGLREPYYRGHAVGVFGGSTALQHSDGSAPISIFWRHQEHASPLVRHRRRTSTTVGPGKLVALSERRIQARVRFPSRHTVSGATQARTA